MSTEAIAGTLESDLRLLSSEARRADGLASQLTGWLSGPEHPQIKEAAERAILRLRSFGLRDDGLEHLRNSKVALPLNRTVLCFVLNCQARSTLAHRMSFDLLLWQLSQRAPNSSACHWSVSRSWLLPTPLLWMVCWWSYRTWSRFVPTCQGHLSCFE